MNYIFIDEVQNVPQFQKAINGLFIKKNCDVYIIGSNAYLLSGELATLLSGRYVEILENVISYVLYRAKRYDIKGKQLFATGSKYYLSDIGLRYYLLGTKNADQGRILGEDQGAEKRVYWKENFFLWSKFVIIIPNIF